MGAQTRREQRESRRVERKLAAERAARRRRQLTMLAGAIGIALIVAIVLIVVNRPGGRGVGDIVAAPALAADLQPNGRTVGAANAPVHVVEYGDYQCPVCDQFFKTVEPQLFANYVKTGKITFEFKDYAFIGDGFNPNESQLAAEAAFCAQDQGKFWQYHDTLYTNQKAENSNGFTKARLEEMAKQVGLNTTTFNGCLDKGTRKSDVDAMTQEGAKLGIRGTPTVFVDGKMLDSFDYATVSQAIDTALAGKK